jgi:hypothetical protein
MNQSSNLGKQKATSKFVQVNGSTVRIDVFGLVVPSFKNAKHSGKSGFVYTDPKIKKRKDQIERLIVSALFSALPINVSTIQMVASVRSLIASLPRDDDWKILRRQSIDSDPCKPGDEGFTITIERLDEKEIK